MPEVPAPADRAQRPTLSTRTGAQYSRIWGVGDHRPERIVTNDEICEYIDSTDEWIRERSGIATRRQAAPTESVADMAISAGRAAIEAAGVDPTRIGAVIVATLSHPLQTPAAATLVAHALGASNAAAFDLGAACSGYCYGIGVADDLIRGGSSEFVLVVGSEKMSDFRDWHDRGTAFIFGDGAGAALVGPSEFPGVGPTVWGADGSGYELIRQSTDWVQWRAAVESPDSTPEQRAWPFIDMVGPSVFRWAAFKMAAVAKEAVAAAGLTIDDIDVFVPHQANIRIIDTMVKQLKLPDRVVVAREDIADMANTSGASVPLATARLLREGRARSGDLCLQFGFGAGLTWAAQVVVLP
ncbi:3-oxoacyl-[acyl-carrier-protein] synthase-3 [Kineosphaera limosa]|uniref:Beta-ketoacyl-[acyl-carrier-protein] synthase III n=1 Tax=Kineosphaera limosa NBRC 100340 TaxID=1184609 RepID=K6X8H3_9MICO|nr:beta-ketoacyl-ACP synthase III [Kineosphaera limosa]NYE02983.1 3-oxoacyl-[acyl-carrier-protein] synthase-3 [Kineosphaera limosa]GAB95124.1 3-oxoacyl-[acyl-carrier-protein] synthase III [Kineosphaera limosa NBRC 100340]